MTKAIEMAKVLVVDDVAEARESIGQTLMEAGFDVVHAADAFPAIKKIQNDSTIDLVTLDLGLEQLPGIKVLEKILEIRPSLPVIIITGMGGVPQAVEAMKHGAYYFFQKNYEPAQLVAAVRNGIREGQLKKEYERLKNDELEKYRIVGSSPKIKQVLGMIDRAARVDKIVLITGETGTGKELVARNIHIKSKRSDKPLVVVNCNSIPDQLFESDLFGHVKGSFTDAKSDRKGKYEMANGGNIFLDEIGDLDMGLQAKLLRVLEDGLIPKVGMEAPVQVDVRHIIATKVDLDEAVKSGQFRNDLYYRINVINIDIPPLRERREDIPLLIEHFLAAISRQETQENPGIDADASNMLIGHDWPGNVRQLRSVMERFLLYSGGNRISTSDVGQILINTQQNHSDIRVLSESLDDCLKTEIIKALNCTAGKKREAAKLLGISPAQFYRHLEKFQLLNNL